MRRDGTVLRIIRFFPPPLLLLLSSSFSEGRKCSAALSPLVLPLSSFRFEQRHTAGGDAPTAATRKPRVNWPLPEWDTAVAPRARPRELPLICTYARLVLPLCLHERISLQTAIGRSGARTNARATRAFRSMWTDDAFSPPLPPLLCVLRNFLSFVNYESRPRINTRARFTHTPRILL